MKGQSFINFLREEDGKADRQKVLSISALVGSSVLAQLMFAGVSQAWHICSWTAPCSPESKETCEKQGCRPECDAISNVMSCFDVHP